MRIEATLPSKACLQCTCNQLKEKSLVTQLFKVLYIKKKKITTLFCSCCRRSKKGENKYFTPTSVPDDPKGHLENRCPKWIPGCKARDFRDRPPPLSTPGRLRAS
ncbi:hypothetical protein CEXT_77981 [Caerostris extrusa]|uniref:Uncharacterized protein n=1 Tax=Caerostris extrusa TaxID=172846 RepID=A0AAV4QJ10_CAEEX|nr:hypothetical protein CEXT_77981 [Caerostris extrusa]